MNIPLPPVERLQAVALHPGDVLVAYVAPSTPPDQRDALRHYLWSVFTVARVVVVLSTDVRLAALDDMDAAELAGLVARTSEGAQ